MRKNAEKYLSSVEVGKNVRKFLFRRNIKISENDLAKVQKCQTIDQKSAKMSDTLISNRNSR